LLAPLSRDQQALVDTIFEVLTTQSVWPTVHYVERRLAVPAVGALLASFPTLGGVRYGAVWPMSVGGMHQANAEVGLTVAGLAHADGGHLLIESFLTVLRGVARRLATEPLHATKVSTLSMNLGDLVRLFETGPGGVPLRVVDASFGLSRTNLRPGTATRAANGRTGVGPVCRGTSRGSVRWRPSSSTSKSSKLSARLW